MAISKPPHCAEVSSQTMGSFVFLRNLKALGRGALARNCFGKRWMWLCIQAAQEEKSGAGTGPDQGRSLSKHSVWPWEEPRQRGLLGGGLGQSSRGRW